MRPKTVVLKTKATSLHNRHKQTFYKCDNGVTYSKEELEKAVGLTRACIDKRVKLFGIGSDMIFYPGRIPQEKKRVNPKPLPKIKRSKEWDRRKCKVHSVPCARYKECCDMRCGLIKGLWIPPDDVSLCYTPQPDRRYGLYPSALSSVSTFGVLRA